MDDADVDKKVVGSIKEAIGTVTGNDPLRSQGQAEQAAAEHPDADHSEQGRDA